MATSLNVLMKEIGQALKLDNDNRDEAAYQQYVNCIYKIATNLIVALRDSGGEVVINSGTVREVKLVQQCVERVVSLVEKMGDPVGQDDAASFDLSWTVSSNKSRRKKNNLEYREKIKSDTERYEAFKAAERERLRQYRSKPKTPEQKENILAKQRERQRKYRAKLPTVKTDRAKLPKMKTDSGTTPAASKPRRSRAKQKVKLEDIRERNRLYAQNMRDNFTPEKRAAVNQKRMMRYYAKKGAANQSKFSDKKKRNIMNEFIETVTGGTRESEDVTGGVEESKSVTVGAEKSEGVAIGAEESKGMTLRKRARM